MIVSEIMSPKPYAVSVTSSIRHVLQLLAEADVRHLPVLENGGIVGIVSDRDLRALTPASDAPEDTDAARRALAQPVSSVMSSNVVSACPEDDVGDVVDLMVEHRIGAVPIVEAGSSKLVGIVSYVDVLRAARDLL